MKKLSINVIAFTLIMALLITAFAAPSNWAKPEVDEARGKNLIVSEADQNYQSFITRELFCKLIVQMIEQQRGTPISTIITNPFVDTSSEAVVKAYQTGIVKGISETQFAPNNLITRQEVAIMMMRAFRVLDQINNTSYTQNVNTSGIVFNDQAKIADWAINDVREAFVLGIVKGVGDNTINPLGNTTIEQSILLSLRLFNRFNTAQGTEPTTSSAETSSTVEEPTSESTAETETSSESENTNASNESSETEAPGQLQIPSVEKNQAPLAKVENLTITVRNGEAYTFVAEDIATDPEGDDLQFVSIDEFSGVGVFKKSLTNSLSETSVDNLKFIGPNDNVLILPIEWKNFSVNKQGELTLKSEKAANNGRSNNYTAIISDGKNKTSVVFSIKVVAADTSVIQTFTPAVLHVLPGQTLKKTVNYFLNSENGLSITNISPSEKTDFGQLSTTNQSGIKYLEFTACPESTLISKAVNGYKVYYKTADDATTSNLKLAVKYGHLTYKNDEFKFSPDVEMVIPKYTLTLAQPPVTKAENLKVNIRNNTTYTFEASDFANDVNGDTLKFVSVKEEKRNIPGFGKITHFNSQIDSEGKLKIVTKTLNGESKFSAVISDGTHETEINFIVQAHDKAKSLLQTFEPSILNVELGKTTKLPLDHFVDIVNDEKIKSVDITRRSSASFGSLNKVREGSPKKYYLTFDGSDDDTYMNQSRTFEVGVSLTEIRQAIDVIVKYGTSTYTEDDE